MYGAQCTVKIIYAISYGSNHRRLVSGVRYFGYINVAWLSCIACSYITDETPVAKVHSLYSAAQPCVT
jgi:hypothetical protein